jgi:hypothetical protein
MTMTEHNEMNRANETAEFNNEVGTKNESTSVVFIAGVSNSDSTTLGLPSCRSVSYTVGTTPDLIDKDASANAPELFSPGAVRSLKNRLRSRVPDAAFRRDSNSEF